MAQCRRESDFGEQRSAMKGLELCRTYYFECAAPAIEKEFGERSKLIAAGLAGAGSDCMGYDDEISRDHDFGPGCCLWLTDRDYAEFGSDLRKLYASLPKSFAGVPRLETPQGAGRVGVMRIGAFYSQFTGCADVPSDNISWFRIPEHFLSAATNGAVFRDDLGEFSRIRSALSQCYPRDILLKKLAARIFVMGQAGQYNYVRIMKRGDIPAASLALAEFARAALSAVHLLNRRYMPYYKWAFRSAGELPRLKDAVAELEALFAQNCSDKAELVESICGRVKSALKEDGLSESGESFMAVQAEEVMKRINDEKIRRMGVSVG